MTTQQLAKELTRAAQDLGSEAVYRKLLTFLATGYAAGYGASEGERGREREYADKNGYFWCPCVLCGRWFSGREALESASLSLDRREGIMVCPSPECRVEAVRLNKMYPDGIKL